MGDGAAGDLTIVRPAAAAPPRRPEPVEQQRAAEAKLRRARFFGTHAPRDKRTIPPARKCRRESTPEPMAHPLPMSNHTNYGKGFHYALENPLSWYSSRLPVFYGPSPSTSGHILEF